MSCFQSFPVFSILMYALITMNKGDPSTNHVLKTYNQKLKHILKFPEFPWRTNSNEPYCFRRNLFIICCYKYFNIYLILLNHDKKNLTMIIRNLRVAKFSTNSSYNISKILARIIKQATFSLLLKVLIPH